MGTTQEPCRRWRELLSPHLEGELEPLEAAALEEHLAVCPSCRRELLLLKETVSILRRLPQEAPPSQILEGVRREMTRPRWRLPRLSGWHPVPSLPVLARVAAVLVVGVSILLIQQRYPFLREESTRLAPPARPKVELPGPSLPPVLREPVPSRRQDAEREARREPARDADALRKTPVSPVPPPAPKAPAESPIEKRAAAPTETVPEPLPSGGAPVGKPPREEALPVAEPALPVAERPPAIAERPPAIAERAPRVPERPSPVPRKVEKERRIPPLPEGVPRMGTERAAPPPALDRTAPEKGVPSAPGGLMGIVREFRGTEPSGGRETARVRRKSVRKSPESASEEKEADFREARPALVLFASAPEGSDIRSLMAARLARLGGSIESEAPLSSATRRRFLDVLADSRLRQDQEGITVNVLLPAGTDAGRVLLADTPLTLLLREEGPGVGTLRDGYQMVTLHVLSRR